MTTEQITELTAIRDLLLEGQPENRTIAAQRLTALLDNADGSHLLGWVTIEEGLTAVKVIEIDAEGDVCIQLSDGASHWYRPDGKWCRSNYSEPFDLDLVPPAAAR